LPRALSILVRVAAVAALYGLTAYTSVAVNPAGAGVAVWIPGGVGAVAAFRFGWPALVGVAVGDGAFNLTTDAPLSLVVVTTLGNVLSAYGSAVVLRRLRFDPALTRLRDAGVLAVAALLNPVPFAVTVAAAAWAGCTPPHDPHMPAVWWAADAVGFLLFGAVAFPWLGGTNARTRPLGALLLTLVGVAGTTYAGWAGLTRPTDWQPLLLAASVILLLVGAGRFGPRGAGLALAAHAAGVLVVLVGPANPFRGQAVERESFPYVHPYLLLIGVGAVCWAALVTQRRAGERRRQADAVWGALRQFAGGVAHHLNNRVTAILGFAELARQAVPVDSRAVPFLAQVTAGGGALATLAERVLAAGGRGVVRVVLPVDVGEAAREAVAACGAGRGRVTVDQPAAAVTLVAHPGLVRLAVRSLVQNAVEATTDRPGEVEVTVTSVHLDSDDLSDPWPSAGRPGRHIRVRVSDTGGGMTPDTRRRMFDPFFTTREPGRGLGLAGVAGVVRAMGGVIRVWSEVGSGTTVDVYLPVLGPPQPAG
jgi:signal transduction histidine kinase